MKANTHGGKRKNSGRKPVEDKKIQVTIYVTDSKIQSHGGLEKLKEKLIHYVYHC
jgi:hypothetical protein